MTKAKAKTKVATKEKQLNKTQLKIVDAWFEEGEISLSECIRRLSKANLPTADIARAVDRSYGQVLGVLRRKQYAAARREREKA